MWPQYTILFFAVFSIGVAAAKNTSDFWVTLISQAITQSILYEGGFYKGIF